jgi:hypothetical protein
MKFCIGDKPGKLFREIARRQKIIFRANYVSWGSDPTKLRDAIEIDNGITPAYSGRRNPQLR